MTFTVRLKIIQFTKYELTFFGASWGNSMCAVVGVNAPGNYCKVEPPLLCFAWVGLELALYSSIEGGFTTMDESRRWQKDPERARQWVDGKAHILDSNSS